LFCFRICDLIKINEKDKRILERKLVCCDAAREAVLLVSPTTLIEEEMLLKGESIQNYKICHSVLVGVSNGHEWYNNI
jgi:hypothetical protein